jgi:transposase
MTSQRNAKIVEFYYAGYSRRAISEAFNITTQRIHEILENHARQTGKQWPPRSMTGGYGTRRDDPKHFKPIPPESITS